MLHKLEASFVHYGRPAICGLHTKLLQQRLGILSSSSKEQCCRRGLVTLNTNRRYPSLLYRCSRPQPRLREYSRYVEGRVTPGTHTHPPWRVLFFGTTQFSLAHLSVLEENRTGGDTKVIEVLDVVVPRLSKCPVKDYAKEKNLQTFEWPIPTMTDKYDVGVVVSFGHLIPNRLIQMFPYGILNVHPSLLPRWRGASPIIHTILNGDQETGISIMEIRPKHFDIGLLLVQVKYPVPEQCSALQLDRLLASLGAPLLLQTLRNLPTLESLEHEQDQAGVTYAHKFSATNARLDWNMQTVDEIDRQYRAISHIFTLRSQWRDSHVRLLDMVSVTEMQDPSVVSAIHAVFPDGLVCPRPGIHFYHKARDILCIRCKDGWVGFRKIVIKKTMSAQAFYNGYMTKVENAGVVFKSLPNDLDQYTFRTSTVQLKLAVSR